MDGKGTTAGKGQLEQLRELELRLAQRITDAQAAEERLDLKASHLRKAEQSLSGLLESLRQAVAEACPMVGELRGLRESARSTVNDAAAGLPVLLAEKLGTFEKQADEALEMAHGRVEKRIEELEAKSGVFEDWLEGEMNGARTAVCGLLEQHEAKAQHVASSLAEVIERSLAKAAELAGVVEKSMEGAVEEVKVRVRGTVDEAAAEVGARAQEKCETARVAMAGALDELDQSLRVNLAQITAAGESALAAAEERLAVRVRDLRPSVWRALEEAEGDVLRRLARVEETLWAGMEVSEREFMDRLAALRPRAVAALKGMEADLARRAAELEAEGAALTAWLERRLAERASAAVDRARRGLNQKMAEEPPDSVEVSVFVRGNAMVGRDDRAEQASAA